MDNSPLLVLALIIAAVVGIFVLVTILKTMYTVRTYSAGVVERFGKFNRVARPGLQFLLPWCETVRLVDLQVRQAVVNVETKTKDNVFVTIPVSVQYQVVEAKVFDAYYKLSESAEPDRELRLQLHPRPRAHAHPRRSLRADAANLRRRQKRSRRSDGHLRLQHSARAGH